MLFTPTVLSPTSSAATSTCKIAGQPRIRRRQRRRSTARAIASDFNPVSTLCGYRVSCADTLLVMRVSRQVGGTGWRAISARLERA